jgi:anti-sigma factor RsiW
MKDSRYIELLNLYVDNQLTPGEAAELEAEVQRSPARRKLYAQYCRMHKACTLLFEADRELAPKTAAAVVAIRAAGSGGGTSPSERGWSWLGWKGLGMAAAAAMAVMVGTRFLMNAGPRTPHDLAGADSLPSRPWIRFRLWASFWRNRKSDSLFLRSERQGRSSNPCSSQRLSVPVVTLIGHREVNPTRIWLGSRKSGFPC